MALTEAEQREWLENDNVRIILVEAAWAGDSLILYCNNGNTDPDYPDIFCNDTYIPSIQSYIYCNATAILSSVDVTYFSNTPYVSDFGVTFNDISGNSVQDIPYDDVLQTIPNISSKIDSSTTVGTLTFYNTEGEYDTYLERAYEGWPIRILMGGLNWPRDDFIQVFDGIIDSVTAPSNTTLSIKIKDKDDILSKTSESQTITNDYVSSVLSNATQFTQAVEFVPIVGDPLFSIEYDPSAYVVPDGVLNTRVPICLGKCYNVEPVLIDAYNHVYQIHDGKITSILEIDGVPQIKSNGVVLNGVPPVDPETDPALQYEIDLNIGCIRLLDHGRSTKITVDVEGAFDRGTGYDSGETLVKNSTAWMMEWLALEKSSLVAADLDYSTFTALDTLNDSELGLFHRGELDVSTLMTSVINSIGAFYRFNRVSQLQLSILDAPENLPAATVTIEQDYVEHNGISLSANEVPRSQLTMSYKKNWTVFSADDVAGILQDPADATEATEAMTEQQKLTSEYQTVTVVNGGIKLEYPLAETNDTIETLIYNKVDAETEIQRRADVRNKKRYIYKLQSIIPPLELTVGDTVNIIYDRFGFDDPGQKAVVIGLSEKLTNNRVEIEAWL